MGSFSLLLFLTNFHFLFRPGSNFNFGRSFLDNLFFLGHFKRFKEQTWIWHFNVFDCSFPSPVNFFNYIKFFEELESLQVLPCILHD